MIISKRASRRTVIALFVAAMPQVEVPARAQSATPMCSPAQVIPLTGMEPAPKIVVGTPLPEPLASRSVVVIPYCVENMRIAPMFGAGALNISPRVGHIHVTVDDATWRWADASGVPVILQGLQPGTHTVLFELVTPNHQVVDKASVKFEVPTRPATPEPSSR